MASGPCLKKALVEEEHGFSDVDRKGCSQFPDRVPVQVGMLSFSFAGSRDFGDPKVVGAPVHQTHDRADDARVDEILDMAHRLFGVLWALEDCVWDGVAGVCRW